MKFLGNFDWNYSQFRKILKTLHFFLVKIELISCIEINWVSMKIG